MQRCVIHRWLTDKDVPSAAHRKAGLPRHGLVAEIHGCPDKDYNLSILFVE